MIVSGPLASQTVARQQSAPTEINRISNAEKQNGLGEASPSLQHSKRQHVIAVGCFW